MLGCLAARREWPASAPRRPPPAAAARSRRRASCLVVLGWWWACRQECAGGEALVECGRGTGVGSTTAERRPRSRNSWAPEAACARAASGLRGGGAPGACSNQPSFPQHELHGAPTSSWSSCTGQPLLAAASAELLIVHERPSSGAGVPCERAPEWAALLPAPWPPILSQPTGKGLHSTRLGLHAQPIPLLAATWPPPLRCSLPPPPAATSPLMVPLARPHPTPIPCSRSGSACSGARCTR